MLWQNWTYSEFSYTFPQNANQYYVSPTYDFKCRTGVKFINTSGIGNEVTVNNAYFQLQYSDDGVTFTKMPMRSGCSSYTNVQQTDETNWWNDGDIETDNSARGIRFQWTNNQKAELTYLQKHRYWRVGCQTVNNSGADSFRLEAIQG